MVLTTHGGARGKKPACQRRRYKRHSLISESRRSPVGGNGSPFQYSCLENPMNRGVCQATVHSVSESDN